MEFILKFVCFISVISAAHCAQFCSNKDNGDKGECLSHEVCEQNNPILNANCEADRSCCSLKFFPSNCEDGLPTIFMLYERRNETNTRLICTGTLINTVFILTAAHCINQESKLPVFAKILGSESEYKISKHFSFPGFANNETHRLNDVGLFRLEEAIDTNIEVKTVCLGIQNFDLEKETFNIYGYDRDSKSIKEATTSFYNTDSCKNYLDTYQFQNFISFQDSFCYDDSIDHVPDFVSGSPIMVKKDKKYYQYGITTLGALERGQTTPAISPKLSIYQGWIIKTVTEFDDEGKY